MMMRSGLTLEEWLERFASKYYNRYQGWLPAVKRRYPYIEVDTLRAWEDAGPCGVREILDILDSLGAESRMVWYSRDMDFGEMPPGLTGIPDEYQETSYGYKRAWMTGRFQFEIAPGVTVPVSEIVWHLHDGYGEEAGTVETWVYVY